MVTINHVYIFIAMVIGGVFVEGLVTSFYYRIFKSEYKRHHFNIGRYVFLLLLPLIGTLFLGQQIGFSILKIFAIFALVGTALEWLIGFSYEYIAKVLAN
ncbi:MAG: hypothetical protein US86_C0008G0019 [Candidatus Daviesbacteria bacterium GW2011_GWA2_38_24]|uniref:Uncharacterized protein n=1 Tax=Candidatus Daviesbacteria bacterium GW2011_GWA2_38_24 TaxID=1618422 RepID=A0A0G0MLJ7_9BACT|nr:MAG: hypothetical protein US86_C0008G0019 [Candidatus Daviesbacteria bacterium GW2011_GWA2_38_24]KKQ79417.1 MAG: hypothetical protein UT01_C0040G0004 [Candidatus Daviesbacteria bacterium GW2011_GWA1_38_7]